MKVAKNIPWIALLAAIVCFGCAKEDLDSLPRSEVFIKYFGSVREDVIIDILKVNEDNSATADIDGDRYLILGTRASDNGEADLLMILTDSAGNRMWETKRDFSDTSLTERSIEVPSRILISDDQTQGWVIGTSYFNVAQESIFIVQFDMADGSIVTDTTFQYYDNRLGGTLAAASVRSRGVDLAVHGTNNLIVLGSAETGIDFRSSADNYCIFLTSQTMTLDAGTGSFELTGTNWTQLDGFDTGDDFGVQLLEDNGQYFYLASTQIPAEQDKSKVMLKLFDPADGNELSDARRVGTTSTNDFPKSLIADQFNLYVTGTTGEDVSNGQRAFFLRIGKSLQNNGKFTLLESTMVGEGSSLTLEDEGNKGSDLVKLDDGNFFIVGTLKSYTNESGVLKQDEIVLTKVNGDGEVIEGSVQVYGSDEDDAGNAVWLNEDGSILIGGTIGFGGDATMMTLIKTNSKGELKK